MKIRSLPAVLFLGTALSGCAAGAGTPQVDPRTAPACTGKLALLVMGEDRESEVRAALRGSSLSSADAEVVVVSKRPRLINSTAVATMMERMYPPNLRDAGITGSVRVAIWIDEEGAVRESFVQESSGHREFDIVAAEMSRALRFTPTIHEGCRVPALGMMPIMFTLVPNG